MINNIKLFLEFIKQLKNVVTMENKVLFILENFYGFRHGRLKCPIYTTSIINRKNATYSRIVPYIEETEFKLYFGETTPEIGIYKKEKFPVDLDWIKQTLEYHDWFAVITCCKKAENALKELKIEPFMSLPHPASWAWRKQMIIDCVDKLNIHYENKSIRNAPDCTN